LKNFVIVSVSLLLLAGCAKNKVTTPAPNPHRQASAPMPKPTTNYTLMRDRPRTSTATPITIEPNSAACALAPDPVLTIITNKDVRYFAFCAEQVEGYEWLLEVDGVLTGTKFVRDPVANPENELYQFWTDAPLVLPIGDHTLKVVSVKSDATTVKIQESAALKLTVQAAVDEACTPPLGTEAISIVITRYLVSATITDISFRLSSKSPISTVSVLVDGAVVKTKQAPGVDFKDFSGLWISTPSRGRHTLAVSASNEMGCNSKSTYFAPLQVK